MLRQVLGVIVGFVFWVVVWVANEKVLSAIWPEWFGSQQRAFEAAIESGSAFNPDSNFLFTQIVSAMVISWLAGGLAALLAGESRRAPRYLGGLLLALAGLKLVMSWSYVPLWYHLLFTAVLYPMAQWGGRFARGSTGRGDGD